MRSDLNRSGSELSKAVERQMRNWELTRAQRIRVPPPQRKEVAEFVYISRTVGSGGRVVAAALAERLRWPLFDKEILQAMAGDDAVRGRLYESMDERDVGWFEETFSSLMSREFPRNDYFHRLCRTVLSIARQGSAVFLGRGVGLILPADRGYRVRLVAPLEFRIRRHAELQELDLQRARREVERIDKERAEFVRNQFHADPGDITRFDIAINFARHTPDQAVELIMAGMRVRGLLR